MAKDLFNEKTGKFSSDDSLRTRKKALINANKTIPILEVAGKSKPLSNKVISIGRDKKNQLIVADPKASRFHALVTFENGDSFIKDTGSSNGTRVNDVRIPTNKKVKLSNGDKIKIGTTVIVYKI